MSPERKWPVTLTVDIESDGLKQVVKEGRLLEFVQTFSTLAEEQIKVQLVDELAKAGAGLSKAGTDIKLELGFTLGEKFGTVPRPRIPWPWPPWPWPRPEPWPESILGSIDKQGLRQIVREELELKKQR